MQIIRARACASVRARLHSLVQCVQTTFVVATMREQGGTRACIRACTITLSPKQRTCLFYGKFVKASVCVRAQSCARIFTRACTRRQSCLLLRLYCARAGALWRVACDTQAIDRQTGRRVRLSNYALSRAHDRAQSRARAQMDALACIQ
jgi:hypothetical protein